MRKLLILCFLIFCFFATDVKAIQLECTEITSLGSMFGATYFRINQGGTSTTTAPSYGQLLVGNSDGTYDYLSTSSLGISGTISFGQSWETDANGNLAPTSSIDVVPDGNDTEDFGAYDNAWKDVFVSGTIWIGDAGTQAVNEHILGSQNVHGVSGKVVGETDAQIVSNKTLLGTVGISLQDGGYIKTDDNVGDTLEIMAYDTDDSVLRTFGKLTANNIPTFDLHQDTTVASSSIVTATSSTIPSIVTLENLSLPADQVTGLQADPFSWDTLWGRISAVSSTNALHIQDGLSASGTSYLSSFEANVDGSITIGTSTANTLTITSRLNADLDPSSNNAISLGAFGFAWSSLFASSTSYLNYVSSTMLTVSGLTTSTFVSGLSASALNITSATVTSTFANGLVLTGGCIEINGSCIGNDGVGANVALSNLSGVAINDSLISDTADTDDLGSYVYPWSNIYASSTAWLDYVSSTAQDAGTILSGEWLGTIIADAYITKTGAWTGTIDGNNFGDGAVETGDLLYGSSAGVISEIDPSTNGYILALSEDNPIWVASSTLSNISGTLSLAKGGTAKALTADNGALAYSDADSLELLTPGTNGNILGLQSGLPAWIASSTFIHTVGSNVGTGTYDFGGATSLEIPNTANPTVDAIGEIAWDTTTNTVHIYGDQEYVIPPWRTLTPLYATSTAWTATRTMYLGPAEANLTITEAICETDTGTVNASLYDGTNRANIISVSTTRGFFKFSTNNTFIKGESIRIDYGTPASTPTTAVCKLIKEYDPL